MLYIEIKRKVIEIADSCIFQLQVLASNHYEIEMEKYAEKKRQVSTNMRSKFPPNH